jgi:hypothetical protein
VTLIVSPSPSNLAPRHIAYLAARAVLRDCAEAALLHNIDQSEASYALGFRAPSAGLCIPQRQRTPYLQVRMDEPLGDAKFLSPAGIETEIYLPWAIPPEWPVLVAEGAIKALSMWSHHLPAVSVRGVQTTLLKSVPLPTLSGSWGWVGQLQGREFYIVFDVNIWTNLDVQRGAARLAVAATRAGAVVRFVRIPLCYGPLAGPDDVIAAAGAQALRTIVFVSSQHDWADPIRRLDELVRGEAQAIECARDILFRLAVRYSAPDVRAEVERRLVHARVNRDWWMAELKKVMPGGDDDKLLQDAAAVLQKYGWDTPVRMVAKILRSNHTPCANERLVRVLHRLRPHGSAKPGTS